MTTIEKPKILHLTLKKKWFDMIDSGKKKEEYREATNFIIPRLMELTENFVLPNGGICYDNIRGAFWFCVGYRNTRESAVEFLLSKCARWREYDAVTFQNGYQKDARRITVQFIGCEYRHGVDAWGAQPKQKYFVIILGEKLSLPCYR